MISIIGGNGFVGTHLSTRLSDAGISYRILTRGVSSKIERSLPCDYESAESIQSCLAGSDILINLAGRFEPPFRDQLRVNTELAYMVFDAAGKVGIRRVIHISAAAVYGDAMGKVPATERTMPKPSTTYALSKLFGEEALFYCARKYAFQAIALRPTNIYGPGGGGVVNALLKTLSSSGVMSITGDGMQRRDFLHVSDMVDAIMAVLLVANPKPVYNVASFDVYSLHSLAELVASHWSGSVMVKHVPAAEGYVRDLVADATLLKRECGWAPKHTLKEAMPGLIRSL